MSLGSLMGKGGVSRADSLQASIMRPWLTRRVPARLKCGSSDFRNCSTRSIHFYFASAISTKTQRSTIVGWAREFPRDQPLEIIIHAPDDELNGEYAN
jgi:hypothetical protein